MATLSVVFAVTLFFLVGRRIGRTQLIVRGPVLALAGGATLFATSLSVVALSAPVFASLHTRKAVRRSRVGNPTDRQLAADLRMGVKTRRVPSNLKPSLSSASDDLPIIARNGCQLQFAGVNSQPCVYGDTTSQTSVVLFGDSHAAAWFPALNAISTQHHWRLLIFVKSACPAEEVNVVRYGHFYSDCPTWRDNTEQQIAALHPALVVVASSQYINGMRPLAGVPTGHGGTWQNGVAATFGFLHRAAQRTVYITDVPMLSQNAPDCLSAHKSDAQRCTVSRHTGFRYPRYTADELRLAAQEHINAVNADSWFCARTRCPVIVKNMLLYRDAQHMAPEWSLFLAPLLDDAITPVMEMEPASRRAR
jgi:SGNH domain (fused to AT3 domains)